MKQKSLASIRPPHLSNDHHNTTVVTSGTTSPSPTYSDSGALHTPLLPDPNTQFQAQLDGIAHEMKENATNLYGGVGKFLAKRIESLTKPLTNKTKKTGETGVDIIDESDGDEERYKKLLVNYDEALVLDPDNADLYYERGLVSYHLEKYLDALNDYSRAIKLNPNQAIFYIARITVINKHLWRGEDYDISASRLELRRDDSRLLSKLSPTDYLSLYKRAEFYQSSHDGDALADYNRLIELGFGNVEVYEGRARVLSHLGRYDEAISDYSTSIELDPKNAELYEGRARVLSHLGRYDEAISDYSTSIELDHKVYVYHERQELYMKLEQFDKALDDCDKAIELIGDGGHPMDRWPFLQARAEVLLALKIYGRALVNYDELVKLEPDNANYICARANVYFELKRYDEALAGYDKAIDLKPKDAGFFYARANFYFYSKEYEKALADYNRVTELNAQYRAEEVKHHKVDAYKQQGQYHLAIYHGFYEDLKTACFVLLSSLMMTYIIIINLRKRHTALDMVRCNLRTILIPALYRLDNENDIDPDYKQALSKLSPEDITYIADNIFETDLKKVEQRVDGNTKLTGDQKDNLKEYFRLTVFMPNLWLENNNDIVIRDSVRDQEGSRLWWGTANDFRSIFKEESIKYLKERYIELSDHKLETPGSSATNPQHKALQVVEKKFL